MKTGYRTIARRRLEAARRIRRPQHESGDARSCLKTLLDDPMEKGSELVSLTTGELLGRGKERGR